MIMLQAHYDEHYAEPGNPFSAFKKRFPRLVQLMRLLRQVRRGHYRRISLPLLLQARHPLHADFLPVYEIVTGGAAA